MLGLARECGLVIRNRRIKALLVVRTFLEELSSELIMKLGDKSFSDLAGAVKALSARLGGLRDIIAQDGTEVSANPQAAMKPPQEFKSKDGGAAVKMHAAWSLYKSRLATSYITSAVSSEREEIKCVTLDGSLIICDVGYPSIRLFEKLSDHGAMMLFKMKSSLKPSVQSCTPFADGRYGKTMDFGGERVSLRDDPRLGGQRSYDCVVTYETKESE